MSIIYSTADLTGISETHTIDAVGYPTQIIGMNYYFWYYYNYT